MSIAFETQRSKVISMREAIQELVHDGMSVAMGLALESMIPFAAGHEIIRERFKDLTLIGPISDMLFDQMVGGGGSTKNNGRLGWQRKHGDRL